jgi:hypothetical protein
MVQELLREENQLAGQMRDLLLSINGCQVQTQVQSSLAAENQLSS